MKFNKTLLLLITLIFIASVGIVVAEDATVGPYTFTVPDEYQVINSTDNLIVMQKDENNVVNFATEVSDDIEGAKENLISQGNELIKEETLNYNDMEITLQAFNAPNGAVSYNYIFLGEDGNFAVTVVTNDVNFDGDLEAEGNPATTIFDTIQVN